MIIDNFFNTNPYHLNEKDKKKKINKYINSLTKFHFNNCSQYKKILNFFNYNMNKDYKLHQLPFLPVQLFKEFELSSVKKNKIIKIMRSSGTSSGITSKIFLDKKNSINQVKALKHIFQFNFGNQRLPMLVLDNKKSLSNPSLFDAKKAAFYGFSIFGKEYSFILDENNNIDYSKLNNFLKKFGNKKFLIFGFTSSVYQHLIKQLDKKKIRMNFSKGLLIHGGGWKKLENKKISKKKFNLRLKDKLELTNVYNYYELVEQTGSIFFECKCGYFITSNFSDVIIRDVNLEVLPKNKKGFIQLISTLSTSYPGHNILTQDIGEVVNSELCNCKINGKRFLVHGRAKKAEVRGCSDV